MKLDELKSDIVNEIPITYNPYVHAFIPSSIGLIVLFIAISFIHNLSLFSLITIPITLFVLFGLEWVIHKYILHHKLFGLSELYIKHELMHHVIYTHDDMSMKNKNELYLILMPPYAIALICLFLFPLILLITAISSFNIALLILITSLLFFLMYEWLHFCYHLPKGHWLSRNILIKHLKQLHTNHHNPLNMKKWNFNVTFPLFDWILKTYRKR